MTSTLMFAIQPHLSALGLFAVYANLAGASFAVVVNYMAYARTGHGGPRAIYAIVAGMAFLYVVAYAILGFTSVLPADWSNVMRGVSVSTWPLVWSSHAAAKVWTRQPHKWAEAVIEEVQKRLEDEAP